MKAMMIRFRTLNLVMAIIGSLVISLSGFAQIAKVDVVLTGGVDDPALQKKIELNLEKLLNGVNTSFVADSQKLSIKGNWFSDSFFKDIEEFWEHTHFYCSVPRINENVVFENYSGYYTIRNIPIVLKNGDSTEIRVSFLNGGIIDGFSISIGKVQYKNAMSSSSTLDLTRKEIVLKFMEFMRTAYIKKDIKYIESIFSDKALIIVGKKSNIQEVPNSGDGVKISLPQDKVEYIEMTKAEYIDRLKGVFARNSYINLSFDSFQLMKHRKYDDFYGVTLRQRWSTPTYSDVGMMFFLIQFKEDSLPKIWVRTWQDEKSAKSSGLYGFSDFIIR